MFLTQIQHGKIEVDLHDHEAWMIALACEFAAAWAQGSEPRLEMEARIRAAKMTPDGWAALVESWSAMLKAAALAAALSADTADRRANLEGLDRGQWFQSWEEVEAIRLSGEARLADDQ
jgi:hypothetical protein